MAEKKVGGARPGSGRPKLPAKDRLSVSRTFHITPKQNRHLKAAAAAKKLTWQNYLREFIGEMPVAQKKKA